MASESLREAVARALSAVAGSDPDGWFEGDLLWKAYTDDADAALAALGIPPDLPAEALRGLAAGTHCVVPKVPTAAMYQAAQEANDAHDGHGGFFDDVWHAMLAARPGAEGSGS
jgi:hypothetical protein